MFHCPYRKGPIFRPKIVPTARRAWVARRYPMPDAQNEYKLLLTIPQSAAATKAELLTADGAGAQAL